MSEILIRNGIGHPLEGLRITGVSCNCVCICVYHFEHHTLHFKPVHVHLIVVKSFVELTRYLVRYNGIISFMFSEKLCLDPLQSFFGKQRMRRGYCDNQTVRTFPFGTSSLCVQGSVALNSVRGICRKGKKATYCCGLHTYGYFCICIVWIICS